MAIQIDLVITQGVDMQESRFSLATITERLPEHGLHLAVLPLHTYILPLPKTLIQKADAKMRTTGPTAHLIILVPGPDLPINDTARCQCFACIGNPQALTAHNFATVPQVGLILCQQFRTGCGQNLIGSLAKTVLGWRNLPTQRWSGVVNAPRLV